MKLMENMGEVAIQMEKSPTFQKILRTTKSALLYLNYMHKVSNITSHFMHGLKI